jgi:hypothetical protein
MTKLLNSYLMKLALVVVIVIAVVSCNNGGNITSPGGGGPPITKPPTQGNSQRSFRPPAYPLITVDPYFSIWAFQDTLYNGSTRLWTGKPKKLNGIIRVDGHSMSFLGQPNIHYKTVLPLAAQVPKKNSWKYIFTNPGDNWKEPDYNVSYSSGWREAKGAFSDNGAFDANNHTINTWTTDDIYVRRTFTLKKDEISDLALNLYHDDNVTVYLNGVLAFRKKGWVSSPQIEKIRPKALNALHKGKNIMAIHCKNTAGGAYLDAGLLEKQTLVNQSTRQTSVKVTATQTIYHFKAEGVKLQVTFTDPLLPNNLKAFSQPADYVTFAVKSDDGKAHNVQLYFSAAGNLAVNSSDQSVVWKKVPVTGLTVIRVGTAAQNILGRKGDRIGIDWGYLYLASPKNDNTTIAMAANGKSIDNFVKNGALTLDKDKDMPRAAGFHPITLATAYDFGNVEEESETYHIILAYDEIHPIEYFHQNLNAWWKGSTGLTTVNMLQQREQNYSKLMKACNKFDLKLNQKAKAAGGKKYAKLCELAYRQAFAACKLAAGPNGKPLLFTKENSSNGDISTVDVMYPTSPVTLYYNPTLLEAMLSPIYYYVESGHWTKPNAPHDLGTYPVANGRKNEESMPYEETGNMLIMTAALSEVEGNASYAEKHWQILTKWAKYFLQHGMDPKNQLTTDDFAGRTKHNANLSVKAIMGIASYGEMAKMLGKEEVAEMYIDTARSMAKKWIRKDKEEDHYKLTFTRTNSWSQKYNLVWDKVFDWNIFPDRVGKNAISYYLLKQNEYGLPLDSRETYTKSDWINWTATMAGDKSTFKEFITPLYRAYSDTKDRIPMTDWYQTTDASTQGFQARSVVGGFFMKLLEQKIKNKKQ